MIFKTAMSTSVDSAEAGQAICEGVRSGLAGQSPDLAFLFVTQHYRQVIGKIADHIRQDLRPKVLLGCTGEGVVSDEKELEREPAVCLWTAVLPEVKITPFHLTFSQAAGKVDVAGWPDQEVSAHADPMILLLAEPYTTPGNEVLDFLQEHCPGAPAVGGMASGAMDYGQNRLVLNDKVHDTGLIGVVMSGPLSLRVIVSQGCGPVSKRFVITRADGHMIEELGGRPALECLQEVYSDLDEEEQDLVRKGGLHIGYAIDEHKNRFERGDFLVRNLAGLNQKTGGLAITDTVKVGQTIQFHLRDRKSASEDLDLLLSTQNVRARNASESGALLFTCNGRGARFFGAPHHDVSAVRKHLGNIPIAGFFAQGEVGPIGGKNFLHGYTASVAIFSQASPLTHSPRE